MSESNLNTNKVRAKKMMLLFALLSITMTFAGLTSAYLVSKGRPDWLVDFQLPNLFFYSTLIIVLSSLTIQISYYYLKTNQSKNKVVTWLTATFLLGIIFCFLQFYSFKSLIEMGYFFCRCSKYYYNLIYLCINLSSWLTSSCWINCFDCLNL